MGRHMSQVSVFGRHPSNSKWDTYIHWNHPTGFIPSRTCIDLLLAKLEIGPAVLSSDMTSAYVLYFPAAAPPPPPIFPNHTNYQII